MNNNALSEKELANRLFALQAENDALKLENESLASIINSDQSSKNNLSENNESDLKFKNMVWDMQVGVMIQNIHSEILLSNPKSLELLGISEEQLLGKPHSIPTGMLFTKMVQHSREILIQYPKPLPLINPFIML